MSIGEVECDMLAEKAVSLVRDVKHNLNELMTDWRSLQPYNIDTNTTDISSCTGESVVQVTRSELDQLATETMMLKEFIPKLMTPDLLGSLKQLTQREQEVWVLRKEREELEKELKHLKRRNESLKTDYEQEKQEKFASKCEVDGLQQQLSQQADYCTAMGAACCTLLWRVSRQEECIHSILSGTMVSEFLQLGASTLQSYLDTYTEALPDETSTESQFILALCGTITNIAASAYGRDFLSSSEEGLTLVETFCTALTDTPTGRACSKLKRLLLMTLYNISINQKGLHYLMSKPDFMRTLTWRLNDEQDTTNRLHIMRLLQSLIMEPETTSVVAQALEAIPLSLLEGLSQDQNQEVRETALELMSDLHHIQSLKLQQQQ